MEVKGRGGLHDYYDLSYTFMSGETTRSNASYPYLFNAATSLIKASAYYDITDDLTCSLKGRYVSDKKRRPLDTRDPLESYWTLDTSIMYHNEQGWYLQGALVNIFNTLIQSPSMIGTYSDDYPLARRSFWLRAGVKF